MSRAPTGTVTFLFTDIEGSTRLLHALGREQYGNLLQEHRQVLREVWAAHEGYVVDTEGDAFFVSFARPTAALRAAAEAQRQLGAMHRPGEHDLRVRMGIHSGETSESEGAYVGVAVHRGARICSAAHGGQVLVSQTTADLCADEELEPVALRDVGMHRLKDLTKPERLFQLAAEGLPSDFPTPRTLESRPTNLPIQPTALIGRERELEEVGGLLRDNVRLVTLTGPGGTGKTRLALQVVADLLEEFAQGGFFVPLAPISDPQLLVPTIARTLGVREETALPLPEIVSNYLGDKRILLLLDNFEQIVEAAPAVSSLLAAAPELKVLATSREPLHLSGEWTYDVPPLPQDDAVALFVERARAVKSDFTITPENAAAIAEVCARLDGLPLAVELAAARVRMLPPQTLVTRLDDRLSLLTGGARDLDERQRTLRATIEWSYDLLSEDDQTLFARLGVFVGGCRLDGVEAVCGGEVDVLDQLGSLIDKNLLRQRQDADGEPRFWLLETIREYARELLDLSVDAEVVGRRHAEHFLSVAEEVEPQLMGPDQTAWLDRMDAERDNLRAALSWLQNAADSEREVRLAASLALFWWYRNYVTEGRKLLRLALQRSTQHVGLIRAKALSMASVLAHAQGDYDEARTCGEESLAIARSAGDTCATGRALSDLAVAAIGVGNYDGAKVLLEESIAALRQASGDVRAKWALSVSLLNLGDLALSTGDFDQARISSEESCALAEAVGDTSLAVRALFNLGSAALGQEKLETASSCFERVVRLGSQLRMEQPLVWALFGFAALAALQEDGERAARLSGVAETQLETLGYALGPTERQLHERTAAAARDELGEECFASALEIGRQMTLDQAVAYALAPLSA